MTTARFKLNRICTVSASSGRTLEKPIEWRFNYAGAIGIGGTASIELPPEGKYAFCRTFLNCWHHEDVHDTDALLTLRIESIQLGKPVLEDGSPDTLTPDAEAALKDASVTGKWIRFRPERLPESNYVQWQATGRADYFGDSEKFGKLFFIDVHSPELHGPAFEWLRDEAVIFSVEGQTAPAPIAETDDKKVWAQL